MRSLSALGNACLLIAAVLIAAFLVRFSLSRDQARTAAILYAFRLPAGYFVLMEDPAHPDLKALLTEEGIEKVVAPFSTDMEKLSALNQWASGLFKGGMPYPNYPPWNARTTLQWIRSGKTQGWCAQYAFVFGQAAQGLGYAIRYVDLASPENMKGHFILEVFVPSEGKWVAFDPSRGVYFAERGKRPLGGLEIHRYATGEKTGTLLEMPGRKLMERPAIRLFYHYRYYLRNNFLTEPVFMSYAMKTNDFEPYRLLFVDRYTFKRTVDDEDRWGASLPSPHERDFLYEVDWKNARESECANVGEFYRLLRKGPPLQLYRVRIPKAALHDVVLSLIHDPFYQPHSGT